jgi:hypothetical protein
MRQTILNHVTFGLFTAALPDIAGSVDIGMRLVSARATRKVRLITAVDGPRWEHARLVLRESTNSTRTPPRAAL